jgi:hypothetical protein
MAVICENSIKEKVYILTEDLPIETKVGDCLFIDKNGKFRIDEVNTKRKN